MDRRQQILEGLRLTEPGLEIGPSYSPLAPKREGYLVSVMDHLDQASLIEKYTGHNVDISAIEPVDYVWSGQSYGVLVNGAKFEWLLASHVIEHSPDLIAFILNIEEILTPTGVLSLAVPDKRFCFDYYRSPSDLARVIDTHTSGHNWPTPGAAAEHYLNAAHLDSRIIWTAGLGGVPALIHTKEDAQSAIQDLAQKTHYHDVHSWTFSPSSFRLLMDDLYHLGYVHLREIAAPVAGPGEFYIKMSLAGAGPQLSRQELALQASLER